MAVFLFYGGLFLQLCGVSSVGLCLFSGISEGDYGRVELVQFVGGTIIFYVGHFLKMKST
ncbi:MAG: hypothetical protein OXB88_09755 [Bacteriovoracales bacterium]|nr:hypothetical protein [Bacteriovoracales bacterium]